MLRFLRLLAIPFAIAAAGYWYWSSRAAPAGPSFITAAVSRGTVEENVLASGTLKPARLVAVGAQVSGRITALHVEVGQEVAEGDLIAEIDSVTQQNELRIAEAALASVRAQRVEREATLALNQRTLERQALLLARSTTTTADHDAAAAAVEVARAQIDALDAQIAQSEVAIETARANLAYTRITAPISGTVLAVISQEGQTVNAAQSAPTIVILGQIDTMTVHAEISEADIARVRSGQQVWFTTLGDSATRYDAILGVIEPAPASIRDDSSLSGSASGSTTNAAIYYTGMFDVPNPEGRLRTYMTVQVNIVLGRSEGALMLPSAALGRQGEDGRHMVRVLDAEGAPAARQVAIGLNNRVVAEVLDGLREGEQVIIGEVSATGSAPSATRAVRPRMGF